LTHLHGFYRAQISDDLTTRPVVLQSQKIKKIKKITKDTPNAVAVCIRRTGAAAFARLRDSDNFKERIEQQSWQKRRL
jgi:hypothetical protein